MRKLNLTNEVDIRVFKYLVNPDLAGLSRYDTYGAPVMKLRHLTPIAHYGRLHLDGN